MFYRWLISEKRKKLHKVTYTESSINSALENVMSASDTAEHDATYLCCNSVTSGWE
jgi:hypothetical protein